MAIKAPTSDTCSNRDGVSPLDARAQRIRPLFDAANLVGPGAMCISFFNAELTQAHLNDFYFRHFVDGFLRTYPYRLKIGEPHNTIIPLFLKIALLDDFPGLTTGEQKAVADKAPFGLAERCFTLARFFANEAYVYDRSDPKLVAGMVNDRTAETMRNIHAVPNTNELKGDELARSQLFHLTSNVNYVTAYTEALRWMQGTPALAAGTDALSKEALIALLAHGGRGMSAPATLHKIDAIWGRPIDLLCSKVSDPAATVANGTVDDLWVALVGVTGLLGITHPSVAETNFGMDGPMDSKAQGRAIINALWRMAAFFMELGLAPLIRRVIQAERVLKSAYKLVAQEIPEADSTMRDILLRIEGLAHMKSKLNLKFPINFVEQAFDARAVLADTPHLFPMSAANAMFGLEIVGMMANTHATTASPVITNAQDLRYPRGLVELQGQAPISRRKLLTWLDQFSIAGEVAAELINSSMNHLSNMIKAPSAYAMPDLPEMHQDFVLGTLRGPDLGKESVFHVPVPLYTLKKEAGRTIVAESLRKYEESLSYLNIPGLQLTPPPAVDTSVDANLAAQKRYTINFPWAKLPRVVSTRSLIPTMLPYEYVAGMLSVKTEPDIGAMLERIGPAFIPLASIGDPMDALLDYVDSVVEQVGLLPADTMDQDIRISALRRIALGLSGFALLRIRTDGAGPLKPWRTVRAGPSVTWGVSTEKFIAENEKYIQDNWWVVDQDLTKDQRFAVGHKNGRVSLWLAMRYPVPGPACPEHVELMEHELSSAYVTKYSGDRPFFTTTGFSTVQGHLLAHSFHINKRYEPSWEDTTQVHFGRTDIIITPNVLVTPAMPAMIAPGELIAVPPNEESLQPSGSSLTYGIAVGTDGADTPEEAMAALKAEGQAAVQEALKERGLVVVAPETSTVGDTAMHPQTPAPEATFEAGKLTKLPVPGDAILDQTAKDMAKAAPEAHKRPADPATTLEAGGVDEDDE